MGGIIAVMDGVGRGVMGLGWGGTFSMLRLVFYLVFI